MNTRSQFWFDQFQINLLCINEKYHKDDIVKDIITKCVCFSNYGQIIAFSKQILKSRHLSHQQLKLIGKIIQSSRDAAIQDTLPVQRLDWPTEYRKPVFPKTSTKLEDHSLFALLDTTDTAQWEALLQYEDPHVKALVQRAKRRNTATKNYHATESTSATAAVATVETKYPTKTTTPSASKSTSTATTATTAIRIRNVAVPEQKTTT